MILSGARIARSIYFKADQPKTAEEKKEYEAGYDHFMVDHPPSGQREGSWHELWKIDISSKDTTKLVHEEVRIGDFTVSPDESKIVYTGRFENRRNQQYLSEIYLLAVGDSSATQLTDNEVPEGGLNWMPDNQHFVYSASSDSEWELRQSKLWMMDSGDKTYEMISGTFDGNISNYEISSDGETIFFTGSVRTHSNLYSLDITSGDVTQHTDVSGLLRVVDFSGDQSRLLIRKENIRHHRISLQHIPTGLMK